MAYPKRELEVYEILEIVRKKRTKEEKIETLQKYGESWALKDILRGSYDTHITWNLPAGEPPYRPAQEHNHPTSLKKENRNFSYFVKGRHGDKLPAFKRENIFIGILEGIHPLDAKLVISMINKEKIEGVTRNVVEEAFPGLLKDSKK